MAYSGRATSLRLGGPGFHTPSARFHQKCKPQARNNAECCVWKDIQHNNRWESILYDAQCCWSLRGTAQRNSRAKETHQMAQLSGFSPTLINTNTWLLLKLWGKVARRSSKSFLLRDRERERPKTGVHMRRGRLQSNAQPHAPVNQVNRNHRWPL